MRRGCAQEHDSRKQMKFDTRVKLKPLTLKVVKKQHVDLKTATTVVIVAADAVVRNRRRFWRKAEGHVGARVGLGVAVGTGVGDGVRAGLSYSSH